jgi:hypothetical protein
MRKLQVASVLGMMFLANLGSAWAVQTSFVEHNSEKQFKGGDPNGVLISSKGEISLGQDTKTLISEEGDVWLVNAMVQGKDDTVYAATSGKGYIYRLGKDKKPEVIYGKGEGDQKHIFSLAIDPQGRLLAGSGGNQGLLLRFGQDGQPEVLLDDEEIKYVWAIEVGPAGRLYLATGPTGKVLTLDSQGKNKDVLFKTKEKNILCLALDAEGMLYAGGDDKGLVYRIDPGSKEVRIVYETGHSEVSALVFDEKGNLYASTADASAARPGVKLILSDGETSRPEEKKEEEEKPEEKLKVKSKKLKVEEEDSKPESKEVKPDKDEKKDKDGEPSEKREEEKAQPESGGKEKAEKAIKQAPRDKEDNSKVKIKNEKLKEEDKDKKDDKKANDKSKTAPKKVTPPATPAQAGSSTPSRPPSRPPTSGGPVRRPPAKVNEVYQISPSGFVRKIFSKAVIILDMKYGGDGQLYLGTGNEGQLLRLDVNRQEAVVLHEAKPSVQVSALCVEDGTVYAGLANPGGLLAIDGSYKRKAYYESAVVDVKQITKWGKVQLDADIPEGAGVWVSTRSGNTSDPKNGGWSDWSDSRMVETDLPIDAEPGRFLQYRLTLASFAGKATPTVREVKLAHMIPNLPPKLSGLTVKRGASGSSSSSSSSKGASAKTFSVSWKAADANKDKMEYKVFLRELGRKNWVRVAKDLTKSPYAWNGQTAADGRYEIKVEASDEGSNPSGTGLTDSRVSRPMVVDNTPPDVAELGWKIEGKKVSVTAKLRDTLSAIGKVDFSVDSAEEWKVAVAVDGVYDSMEEIVKFSFEAEEAGEHLLSIRFGDALGNVTYRNVRLETN